jgi:hypothetical protein
MYLLRGAGIFTYSGRDVYCIIMHLLREVKRPSPSGAQHALAVLVSEVALKVPRLERCFYRATFAPVSVPLCSSCRSIQASFVHYRSTCPHRLVKLHHKYVHYVHRVRAPLLLAYPIRFAPVVVRRCSLRCRSRYNWGTVKSRNILGLSQQVVRVSQNNSQFHTE